MNVYLVVDSALQDQLLPRLSAVERVEIIGATIAGLEARNAIRRAKPHLVIVSVSAEVGSGSEVLAGLQEGEHRPLVYTVSRRDCQETRSRCTRAGAARYFHLSQLDGLVDAVATLALIC